MKEKYSNKLGVTKHCITECNIISESFICSQVGITSHHEALKYKSTEEKGFSLCKRDQVQASISALWKGERLHSVILMESHLPNGNSHPPATVLSSHRECPPTEPLHKDSNGG